ncbi:gag/pol protein [Cucumis melo var. makuwa]|nr:gag/pol protein [Cucumis melo var. makuwa]
MDEAAMDERWSDEVADDGDGEGITTERETETERRDGDWRVRKREGWRDGGVHEDEKEEDERFAPSSSGSKKIKKRKREKGKGPTVAAEDKEKAKVAIKGKCFQCYVDGHWKRSCPKYLAKKKEKEGKYDLLILETCLVENDQNATWMDIGKEAAPLTMFVLYKKLVPSSSLKKVRVARLPTRYAYHFGDKTEWGVGNIITQDGIHSFPPLRLFIRGALIFKDYK